MCLRSKHPTAKNSCFHRKYDQIIFKIYLKSTKTIPLRVWGRLGPYRVSQILPCFNEEGSKLSSYWELYWFEFVFSGATTRRFVGHTKDVLSVAFSADNRQIVSGSRDKTVKLWNTLGVCKYTIQVNNLVFRVDNSLYLLLCDIYDIFTRLIIVTFWLTINK